MQASWPLYCFVIPDCYKSRSNLKACGSLGVWMRVSFTWKSPVHLSSQQHKLALQALHDSTKIQLRLSSNPTSNSYHALCGIMRLHLSQCSWTNCTSLYQRYPSSLAPIPKETSLIKGCLKLFWCRDCLASSDAVKTTSGDSVWWRPFAFRREECQVWDKAPQRQKHVISFTETISVLRNDYNIVWTGAESVRVSVKEASDVYALCLWNKISEHGVVISHIDWSMSKGSKTFGSLIEQ